MSEWQRCARCGVGNYIEAGIAEVERWSFMVAANSLCDGIAEAEKIGRGE